MSGKRIKPKIGWSKTTDPLKTIDSIIEEQKLYSLEDIPSEESWEDETDQDEDEDEIVPGKNINVLLTSMGGMVLDSSNNLYKLFNFWNGDTNFDITEEICNIIETVPGVEILNIFSRYRFRIAIGRLFDSGLVKAEIQKNVFAYIKG